MIESRPGVAEVLRIDGPHADPEADPTLLVEVPHGADTQAHYDHLREQLASPLPDRLERFFWVNTDVAAWDIGLRTAQRYVERVPTASALAIRCAIPRTFVDVNRVVGEAPRDGLTPGMQPWITDATDRRLLSGLHARYTALVKGAYRQVCGGGGLALIPHTYAPRSVPITSVGMDIVEQLERCYQPDAIEEAPLRSEVDLITVTPEGEDLAPPGLADALTPALAEIGLTVQHNHAYNLHPVTMGARWSNTWPGKVLCFEVRRDLVTKWEPFVAKSMRDDVIGRIADTLAGCLAERD